MSSILGGIFGFGDKLKRRLKDAVSNPRDYLEMTADENQREWQRDPIERSMGFFNPVPLGSISPFLLRQQMKEAVDEVTNMSRRDFMKKSAGVAGGTAAASIPGAKLLQKFAPEERTAVKQAAVEAAPKYKYNSLKEYLDDVTAHAEDRATAYTNQYGGDWRTHQPSYIRGQLLGDELKYTNAKRGQKLGDYVKGDEEALNAFSPQAKKEMKEFKELSGKTYGQPEKWSEYLMDHLGL